MWAGIKRYALFFLTNILVIVTLSIVWSIAARYFGINPGTYSYLLGFCILFGFGGAFISLFASKFMAKMFMKVQIIDPRTNDPQARNLVEKVHGYARAAGLNKMPEVGIYDSPELNAFATGPSRNNSLVAVSTGLLRSMNSDQVDGVLGHEVAHIANGDMVTMTLIQGVINAIVMFAARILANIVASAIARDERPSWFLQMGLIMAFEILFSFFGMIVVTYFSRYREFRADSGGAKLAGKDKMIAALEGLQRGMDHVGLQEDAAVASLKISGKSKRSKLARLFMTHPPIEERIEALRRAPIM